MCYKWGQFLARAMPSLYFSKGKEEFMPAQTGKSSLSTFSGGVFKQSNVNKIPSTDQ